MAFALINKYYTDVVVNNITLSGEMYDEMGGMSADVLADLNDQTRLRRNWLLKTRNDETRTEVLNKKLREFTMCGNARRYERSNHVTMDITSFDNFKHCFHSAHTSLADYLAKDESGDLTFGYCATFYRALELLTMVNEPTDPHYCIKVRLDKRTVGMYWRLPREFHWLHRPECAKRDCACCTGYIDWSPVFEHTCDAWRLNPGATAEHFYTDLVRTRGVLVCDYGTRSYPSEPVKRERDEDVDSDARKVRMCEDGAVDLTSDSSDNDD